MTMSVAPAGAAPLSSAPAPGSAVAMPYAPVPGPPVDLQSALQALAAAVQALSQALAGAGTISAGGGALGAPPAGGALSSIVGGASGGVPAPSITGGGGTGCGCSQASSGAGALGAPTTGGAMGAPTAPGGKRRKKQQKHQHGSGASPAPTSPTQAVSPYQGASGGKLTHPLPGARLSSHFGEVSSIRSSAHDGTDFAKAAGSPIVAAAAGKVVKVAMDGDGYGNYITIDHGNGFQTRYAHMLNASPLKVGDTVQAGQTIGKVGSTGNSTGPHLHFMIMQNGKPVNAEPYLNGSKTF